VLRGKNSRTGWFLLTIGGRNEQVDRPSIVARDNDVTDETLVEANRLFAAENDARKARSLFINQKKLNRSLWPDTLIDEETGKTP